MSAHALSGGGQEGATREERRGQEGRPGPEAWYEQVIRGTGGMGEGTPGRRTVGVKVWRLGRATGPGISGLDARPGV